MKAAIYLRVSTPEQDVNNQLPALEDYAQRHKLEIYQIYYELETAWKDGHHPGLAQLLEDARTGKFRVLLVWALDRLSRQGALAILTLVDRLKNHGVKVISYQEAWTEAPGELADILYAITGWVAKMESQRRSERTKAGMERARLAGAPIGKRGTDLVPRTRRWKRKPAKTVH